jgi:hypothetical protein
MICESDFIVAFSHFEFSFVMLECVAIFDYHWYLN